MRQAEFTLSVHLDNGLINNPIETTVTELDTTSTASTTPGSSNASNASDSSSSSSSSTVAVTTVQTVAVEGGSILARGGNGLTVPAAGRLGAGFACCGAFKYHLVAGVPDHKALRVALNVTSGAVRALYLKQGTCPRYPDDVDGDTCIGSCVLTWYTIYEQFDGRAISQQSGVASVPMGFGGDPDLRQSGDWYVAVQALSGEEAEYTLTATLVEPPPEDGVYRCDRWEGPCPAPYWRAADRPAGVGVLEVSAAPSHSPRGVARTLTALVAPVLVAVAMVEGGAGHGLRRGGHR